MNKLLESKYPSCNADGDAFALHMFNVNDLDPEYTWVDNKDHGIFHVVFSVYAIMTKAQKKFPSTYTNERHWSAENSIHGRFCCKAKSIQRLTSTVDGELCLSTNMIKSESMIMFLAVAPSQESHPYQTLPLFVPYIEYSAWCSAEKIGDELPVELDMMLMRWNCFSYTCNPKEFGIGSIDFVSAMFNCIRTKYAKQEAVLKKLTPGFCAEFYKRECKAIKEADSSFITYSTVVEFKKIVAKSKHFSALSTVCWHMDQLVDAGWAGGVMRHPGINGMFKMTEALSGGNLRLEGHAFLLAACVNYRVNVTEPVPSFKFIPKMTLFNLLLFVPEVFLDSALWTLMVMKTTGELRRKLSGCAPVDRSVLRSDPVAIAARLCGASHVLDNHRRTFRTAFYSTVFSEASFIDRRLSNSVAAIVAMERWRVIACAASRSVPAYIVPEDVGGEWEFLSHLSSDFGAVVDFDPLRTLTAPPSVPKDDGTNVEDYFPFWKKDYEMPTNNNKKYSSSELCYKMSVSRLGLVESLLRLIMRYDVLVLECSNTQAIIDRESHQSLRDVECIFVCPTQAHQALLSTAWHPVPVYTVGQVVSDSSISSTAVTMPLVFLYAHLFSLHQVVAVLDIMMSAAVRLGKRDVDELELRHVRKCFFVGLAHFMAGLDGSFVDVFHQLTYLAHPPVSMVTCMYSSKICKAVLNISSVSDAINRDCSELTSQSILDVLEKARKRVVIKDLSGAREYDDNMMSIDGVFPIYLKKADNDRLKLLMNQFPCVITISATYGTFVRLTPKRQVGDSSIPVCFCKYANSGIFGPALADLKSTRYYCAKIIPESIAGRIPKIFCPKCSIPLELSSSNSSSSSSAQPSMERLMAYDASEMQLKLQFHPRYPSCFTPQQYMGCAVPQTMLVVGSYLPYEQLVAALDITIDKLVIVHLQGKLSVTRIPTGSRKMWLRSMAEVYVRNADVVLAQSDDVVKRTKME